MREIEGAYFRSMLQSNSVHCEQVVDFSFLLCRPKIHSQQCTRLFFKCVFLSFTFFYYKYLKSWCYFFLGLINDLENSK